MTGTSSAPPPPHGTFSGTAAGSPLSDRVRRIVADVFQLEDGQVTLDSSPRTIEKWDSVNHLNLILALETEFHASFSPEEIDHFDRVEAIVQALEGKAGPPARAPGTSGSEPVIRRLEPHDLPAVVTLLSQRDGQEYGRGPVGRYLCDLDPSRLLGWIAFTGDRPVGMTVLYLRRVVWGREVLDGGYWAHLYVHQDMRRHLVYPRLVHTMMEEAAAAGVALIYTGTRRPTVAEGHVSIGFEPLGALGVRVKPLRPFALLARYRGWKSLETVSPLFDLFYRGGLAARRHRPSSGIRIEATDSSSPHLDRLLDLRERQAGSRVHQQWTPESWRLRFGSTLEGWPYTLLLALDGPELLGGLLMRVAVRDAPSGGASIRLGVVMDLVVPEERGPVAARLLGEAERRATRDGCLGMLWLDGVPELGPLMKRLGYRDSPETYRMIVWPPTLVPMASPMRSISNWRFPFSEHDAF